MKQIPRHMPTHATYPTPVGARTPQRYGQAAPHPCPPKPAHVPIHNS